MTGIDVNVPLSADPAKLDAAVAAAAAKVAGLRQALSGLQINADATALTAKISGLQAQAVKLANAMQHMDLDVDIQAAADKILAITAEIKVLQSELLDLKMDADTTALMTRLTVAEAELNAVTKARDILINVDESAALNRLATLKAVLSTLQQSIAEIHLDVNDTAGLAKLTAFQVQVDAMTKKINSLTVDVNIAPVVAQLLALQAAVDAFKGSSVEAATAAGLFNDSIRAGLPVVDGFSLSLRNGGLNLGNLTGHVQLFAGALTGLLPTFVASASGFHIVADAAVEIIATLGPALIALGAFGASAVDTVDEIYNHFVNLDKVSDELNTTLYPLTGAFSAMNKAAQPQVYVLLGEGLKIISANAGVLATVAQQAGGFIDQLGARITNAVTSGDGFNIFVKNAANDLLGWGNNIGDIFGILGNVLKVMPGYAQIILNMTGTVLQLVEAFTGSGVGQAIIGFGLAFHGALLYIGLLSTAASALISKVLPLLATGIETVAKGFAAIGAESAAGAMAGFSVAAEDAATLPWGWITLAAAGIAVLVYDLLNAKTAAQQFADAIQKTITAVKLSDLGSTITSDIHNYATALQEATAQTAQLQAASAHVQLVDAGKSTQQVVTYSAATYASMQNVADYAAALKLAQNDQTIYNANLDMAAEKLGGTKAALAALTGAGITSTQMLTTSKSQMAENIIEAQAYNEAIKAVTNGTGQEAAALNALSGPEQYLGDMLKNIESITAAQDKLITVVTESESAFDTFALGTQTLGTDMAGTGAKVTDTLGHISVQSSGAASAIGGLTNADLNLNQAFYDQITNAQKVIDALEQQETSAKNMSAATATLAQQMLPFAQNNNAARASIVAMINDAIGPGTVSLNSLNGWVAKNATTMQGFQNIVNGATIKAGQLANVLQGDLNPMMAASIIAADGGQKAFDKFATSIQSGDTSSTGFQKSAEQVITTLLASGLNADAAKTKFIDYATSLGLGTAAAGGLWNALSKQLLDQASTKAGETETQFIHLAAQLGLTTTQAEDMWTMLGKQQLDTTASKALAAKNQFYALAEQFNLTSTQISDLWTFFSKQLLDQTTLKAGETKTGFFNLASQLGITGTQAQNLWTTLSHQLLDQAATKAGETKGEFDKLATSMNVSTTWADNLWNSLHKLPAKVGTEYTITGHGTGQVSASENILGEQVKTIGNLIFVAGGGKIPGHGSGDTVHAMLTPGEVVVPKGMVAAGAVDHLKGKLPGFASGAFIGPGASLPGASAAQGLAAGSSTTFLKDATNAGAPALMAKFLADTAAAVTAQQVAAAAIGATAAAGPGGGAPAANAALAKRLYPAWSGGSAWNAWNALELSEAGWNQFATNPSSGAYGIPQALPPTKMPFAAQAAGGSNPTAQINWMVDYILSTYGSPEAAEAHEQCVPLTAEILTRRGWLTYDQIRAGDETIGFNPVSGRSEWTTVEQTHVYEDAPLVRLTNKTWAATCTPQHRWVAKHWYQNPSRVADEFVEAGRITSRHALRVAAEADTGGGPAISEREAELLGWVLGDGSVAYPKRRPTDSGTSPSIRLYQAKPEHVAAIDELIEGLMFNRMVRVMNKPDGRPGLPLVTWQFTFGYSAELLKRSGYDHKNPVPFVLSLSPEQREAFMRGVFSAEGSYAGTGEGFAERGYHGYPRTKVYAQNDGPQQDAITLGVYLSGHRPGISELDHRGRKIGRWTVSTTGAVIRETKPSIGGESVKREDAGRGPAWCPTTGLGSWTMRQGRQVMLTGNSYHWYKQGGKVRLPKSSSARRYDSGGWLPTGASVAVNNTGSPERVTPGGGSGKLSPDAQAIVAALQENTAAVQGQGTSFSRALNTASSAAAFRGSYSNRR
jgi:hypothetical protein